MHKNRNESRWSVLAGSAKRHWNKLNRRPLEALDIKRSIEDEDADEQKIKRENADKHLRNVENMLKAMSSYSNKNGKQFDLLS